ncbi:MAG: 3-phosphoshikimate 1-carboxyvinyltransferase [Desulfobacterales bacterium]
MREIKPIGQKYAEVTVPGSKSYTHRMLIAASLSNGSCRLKNTLESEDTGITLETMRKLGVSVEKEANIIVVHGKRGSLDACQEILNLGNSGTSMRLLTAVVALGRGKYVLTGSQRMQQRPMQHLIDGLNQIGVRSRSVENNGCPPIEVETGAIKGGTVNLNCSLSSQFLSALLLIAPYAKSNTEIVVTRGPVSRPYIDITLDVMQKFGVTVVRENYDCFKVPGGQTYQAGSFVVEPDCSQAGYFWAAAAVTGATIKVKDISLDSQQGDIRFLDLLAAMGCKISKDPQSISVTGGSLKAIDADMADMPDLVPTLAVIAAFARGTTIIKNVAHLKGKESDRLDATIRELTKMGIDADCSESALRISGGEPHGAEIQTYNDHRIAMSFAVAGLRVPGIVIKDEDCAAKSFPDFWQKIEALY